MADRQKSTVLLVSSYAALSKRLCNHCICQSCSGWSKQEKASAPTAALLWENDTKVTLPRGDGGLRPTSSLPALLTKTPVCFQWRWHAHDIPTPTPLCGCWVVWHADGCGGCENELIPVTRRWQRFCSLSTSGWTLFAGKLIKMVFAADTQRADESGQEAWIHLYHPPELRLFPFRSFHSRSLSGRERATHTTTNGVEL